jgi:hypothetical protein
MNIGSVLFRYKKTCFSPVSGFTSIISCKNETKLYSNLNLGVRIMNRFGFWAAGNR